MIDVRYLAVFWFVVVVFYSVVYLLKVNSTFTDYAFLTPRIITGVLSEVGVPYVLHSLIPSEQDCHLGFSRPSVFGYCVIFALVSSFLLLCGTIYNVVVGGFFN
jgi:hypothetical protein